MKEVTLGLYTAKELKESFPDVFKSVHNTFLSCEREDYLRIDEVNNSLKYFLDLFGCDLIEWDASEMYVNYTTPLITLNEESYALNELSGDLLDEYFKTIFTAEELELFHSYEDSPLTTLPSDCEPLRVIHNYLKNPRPNVSLKNLLDQATLSLMKEFQDASLYFESEDCFFDYCSTYECYFFEDGSRINPAFIDND